jgi:tetratricopeptide (TPR) repeat protein
MKGEATKLTRLLLCAVLCLPACSKREPDDCGPSGRVVDPVLLAFLSQARSAHHLADQHESANDVPGALRALEALSRAPRPPGDAPEVGEVLADTHARRADLLSRAGRFDHAAEAVDEGLKVARATTYFRGHLFEVRGLLEERREKAERSAGRGPEADRARERSLGAYEEAMKIQAEVIQKATGAARPSTGPRE